LLQKFHYSPDTFAVVTTTPPLSNQQPRHDDTNNSFSTFSNRTKRHSTVVWGHTEVVTRSRHPQWVEAIEFEYKTGQEIYFYVHIFETLDNDEEQQTNTNSHPPAITSSSSLFGGSLSSSSSSCICLGTALFHVPELLSTRHRIRAKRLRNGGCLYCYLEPIIFIHNNNINKHDRGDLVHAQDSNVPSRSSSGCSSVTLQFQACDLIIPGKRIYAPDTILEIAKRSATDAYHYRTVLRTAVVEESRHPIYNPCTISIDSLCDSILDTHLQISIWETANPKRKVRRRIVTRQCIGLTETTLRHILQLVAPESSETSLPPPFSSLRNETIHLCSTTMNHSINGKNDNTSSSYKDKSSEGDDLSNNQLPFASLVLQRSLEKSKRVGTLRILRASMESIVSTSENLETDAKIVGHHSKQNEGQTQQNGHCPLVGERVGCIGNVPHQVFTQDPLLPSQPTISSLASSTLLPISNTRPFSEYLQKTQIDFCVAIDFTSSNGDPYMPSSNHCLLSLGGLNDYEETIVALGEAIESKYPNHASSEHAVWGFGAKFDPNGPVRHIFQCGSSSTVHGVDGILDAYKSVFRSDLIMSGPTVFAQVLQAAAARAKRHHTEHQQLQQCIEQVFHSPRYSYTVLVIITDGIMEDVTATRERLDLYSTMPLSVVFVGVGRSDFRVLDSLCQPSSSSCRCNTTFVQFRQLQHDPAALGDAALRNIPIQLWEYMQQHGL
jgi:hypothetical protein